MDAPIVVVTGLPRSGTSMLMQMLQAGGLPILADAHRASDEHNPRGYLEYEPVKLLARDNAWVGQARGRAVKVIVQLLPYLPREFRYQVLWIQRPIDEVVASQAKMLRGLGRAPAADASTLAAIFARQLQAVQGWLANQSQMTLLTIDYQECVANPLATSQSITDFLRPLPVDAAKMATAVDRELRRTTLSR